MTPEDEQIFSEDDPNAPDEWYDEPEDMSDEDLITYMQAPLTEEERETVDRLLTDVEADRLCAHMLRKSIVDFMVMAEAFDLITDGLRRARKDEVNVTRWQARHFRLRRLCGLEGGESWSEAQARYHTEVV